MNEACIPGKGDPGVQEASPDSRSGNTGPGSCHECQRLGFAKLSSLALSGNDFIREQGDGGTSGVK